MGIGRRTRISFQFSYEKDGDDLNGIDLWHGKTFPS
jgi:hypothetical protein